MQSVRRRQAGSTRSNAARLSWHCRFPERSRPSRSNADRAISPNQAPSTQGHRLRYTGAFRYGRDPCRCPDAQRLGPNERPEHVRWHQMRSGSAPAAPKTNRISHKSCWGRPATRPPQTPNTSSILGTSFCKTDCCTVNHLHISCDCPASRAIRLPISYLSNRHPPGQWNSFAFHSKRRDRDSRDARAIWSCGNWHHRQVSAT